MTNHIKPESFDIDRDPDGLSLRHDADGRLTARDGARVWTSVDQGRTWKAVEADCDGLPADWSWLGKVAGELGSVAQRVVDVARIDGPDFRTVEVQDGKGQRVGKIRASTTTPRTPIARPSFVVVDDLEVLAIRLDGIDLSAVGTQAGRGQRSRAVPFTDTPGPDGTGERSGIMIEVPAEGWPKGWHPCSVYSNMMIKTEGIGTRKRLFASMPNTEPGRRAAWAMEGK